MLSAAVVAVGAAAMLFVSTLPGSHPEEDPATVTTQAPFTAGLRTIDSTFGTRLAPNIAGDGSQRIAFTETTATHPLAPLIENLVLESGLPGIAVSVIDLQTGELVSYRGNELQRSGCVINVFPLLLAMNDIANGYTDLDSFAATMDDILGYSDAAAAFDLYTMLGDGDVYVGMERVEYLMYDVLGLYDTLLDHPPGYEWHSRGLDGNNWVTANAMTETMARLYHGELLPPEWTEWLLEHMTHVSPNLNYLLGDLPPNAVVSHKNGWFDYDEGMVENDTAIVRFEVDGQLRAYAITYLSDATDYWAAIELGSRISNAVYAYFGGTYPEGWDSDPVGPAYEAPYDEAVPDAEESSAVGDAPDEVPVITDAESDEL